MIIKDNWNENGLKLAKKKNTQKQIKVLKESENERKNSIICSCAFWPPPNFTPPVPHSTQL